MCKIVESMYHQENLHPDNVRLSSSNIPNTMDNNTKISTDSFCPPFWDTLSCFPATPAGKVQVIPCVAEMQTAIDGVIYKTMLDTTSKSILRSNESSITSESYLIDFIYIMQNIF